MILSAKDISERLAREAERVCRHLLPGGKLESGNWRVGSLAGEPGQSLGVQVTGSRAGIWADFAHGGEEAKGDLLDLWVAVKSVSLSIAIKEAKEWLGIYDPAASNPPQQYAKPFFPKNIQRPKDTQTDVEKYLTEERKLSRETILAFSVAEYDYPGIGRAIAFPSRAATGEWLALKYIGLNRTWNAEKKRHEKIVLNGTQDEPGKKTDGFKLKQYPILFGWQALDKNTREVVICEGQIDAMTWHQWGFPALSVPNGCKPGESGWIDCEWENLMRFDQIYLSFDMDEAGIKASEEVARRIGMHRCLIVKLPHNDANECLQKGCTSTDISHCIAAAKPIAPKEIRKPIEFENEILEMENPPADMEKPGLEFPMFGNRIRFLPGEVTVWTGHSFHGKSTLLNQLALQAAMAGQSVAIGSFEMKGRITCANLSRCLAFKANITPVLRECLEWMSGKIWIFDIIGFITQAKIKELILYSAMRHGVKHVIIDSLMKCDLSCEDYDAQRKFFNEFSAFAHEYGIHLHIVAHPRKGDHNEIPDIADIHGGQAIGGQVDNVITVWRNIKKAEQEESGKLKKGEADRLADAGAYVRKNRTGGDRFSVPLWYHRGCHRFTSKAEEEPYYENYGIIKPQEET